MLKGSRKENGDKPRPKHHVTLAEPVHDHVDGDADSQADDKSILLKKMTFSQDSIEGSPSKDGSNLSVNTGSTIVIGQIEPEVDNTCLGKCKRFLQCVYAIVKSVAGLLVLLIIYSILGALMFMKIESRTYEIQNFALDIVSERQSLIDQIHTISGELSNGFITKDQWNSSLQTLIEQYEDTARNAPLYVQNTTTEEVTWDFWSSLFFVGTIYTTIGYGHIVPSTKAGKVACMFYAAIGIPLALLVLAELGKRFTVALKVLWAFVRRFYYTGTCKKIRKPFTKKYELNEDQNEPETKSLSEKSRSGSTIIYGYEVDEDFNIPITVALGIMLVYLVLGAMMYSLWEEWEFIDAIYFVFISISTIGFGDILPAHPKFFIMSFAYLFFGLSLVSMCINVAIEFFSKTVDQAKLKMQEAKHKMGEAKDKIGQRVNQAGKNVKDKAAGIKTNIMDETQKIVKKTDEKLFRKRSRSATPVSLDSVPEELKEVGNKQDT